MNIDEEDNNGRQRLNDDNERRRLDQERRDNEYRERQREDTERIIRAMINSINNMFSRQKQIDDPVVRYSIFVNTLSMSLDIMLGVVSSILHDEKYPYSEDILLQTQKVTKIVQDELVNLMNYVRSPSYSPEAPFGKSLVENMSNKFNAQVNNMSENFYHHPTDKNLE